MVAQQRRNPTGELNRSANQTSQGRIQKSTSRKKTITQMKAAQMRGKPRPGGAREETRERRHKRSEGNARKEGDFVVDDITYDARRKCFKWRPRYNQLHLALPQLPRYTTTNDGRRPTLLPNGGGSYTRLLPYYY